MTKQADSRMWGGRFQEQTDAFVEAFTASIDFDQRLAMVDIQGSIAHAKMLTRIGILTEQELESILTGLSTIQQEIESGGFEWSIKLEDVHMNIEARLTQLIGDAGKKLHTGRSRNDQVATDIRLFMRSEIEKCQQFIRQFQHGLLNLAEQECETILPGFTHYRWHNR